MSRASVVSRIAHEKAEQAPGLLTGEGPWWERLDPEFYRQPEPFDLQFRDRCWVGMSAASDILLRTAGALLVGGLSLPLGYNPFRLARLRSEADFYRSLADAEDPDEVFVDPPTDVEFRRSSPRFFTFEPDDGTVEDLTFDSAFEPINPGHREAYLQHEANRTAHARWWRHDDGPRPTIVVLHGFSADLALLNQWFFEIPWLFELGCDVLLATLPFHGARQTRFSPFSGHGYFAGGVPRINEAMAHSVHDLRVFVDFLYERQGVDKIGMTGISLGGYTTAMMAAVEPRLSFAVPNVPLASLPDLVLEWSPMNAAIRGFMYAMNAEIEELRHMLAVSSPLTFDPVIPQESLMIIGGVGDRLAPPKHSRLLWDHWDRCAIHWFPGSHILHWDKGEYLGEMARFMARHGFID